MNVKVKVEAGVCGFQSQITAQSDDQQMVTLKLASGCEKIRGLAAGLAELGPLDAYAEVFDGKDSLLGLCRQQLTTCCAGCAVPVALYKAMQVAANLALPATVIISMSEL